MTWEEVLKKVTEEGLGVNLVRSRKNQENLNAELLGIERRITEVCGRFIRPNSTKDIAEYFAKKAPGLVGHSKSGRVSMRAEVLQKLEKEYPEAKLFAQYRTKRSALSMIEALMVDLESRKSNRIHPKFVSECSTGRIYAAEPSAMNLPQEIRETIVPEEGNVFVNFDYRAQEMLLLAKVSGQTDLADAILKGEDIHQRLADSTGKSRDVAKMLHYAVSYGITAESAAYRLDIPIEEATQIINKLWATYPKVKLWLEETKRIAEEGGVTTTLISKRPYFVNRNETDQNKEIRRAVNHVIQGTGADVLKKLLEILGSLAEMEIHKAKIRMVAHDAILVEMDKTQSGILCGIIKEIMEHGIKGFTFAVDFNVGNSWREAQGK